MLSSCLEEIKILVFYEKVLPGTYSENIGCVRMTQGDGIISVAAKSGRKSLSFIQQQNTPNTFYSGLQKAMNMYKMPHMLADLECTWLFYQPVQFCGVLF